MNVKNPRLITLLLAGVVLAIVLSSILMKRSAIDPLKEQAIQSTNPPLSSACLTARAAEESTHLSTMDAFTRAQKAAITIHVAALKDAAALAEVSDRQVAVKKADKALQAAMSKAAQAQQSKEKAVRDATHAACAKAQILKQGIRKSGTGSSRSSRLTSASGVSSLGRTTRP